MIADMDSGAVLSVGTGWGRYAPLIAPSWCWAGYGRSSTNYPWKATVVANEADTRKECNGAGVTPGAHLHGTPAVGGPSAGLGQ